jgi:hypothetical protein
VSFMQLIEAGVCRHRRVLRCEVARRPASNGNVFKLISMYQETNWKGE